MQEAVPQGTGAMAAVIGLDDDKIEAVCAQVSNDSGLTIEAVNYNAPGQLVIAGHAEAVEVSLPMLKEAGAKRALSLPVSAPFHCALMKPAADRLKMELDAIDIQAPTVPVIQNVSIRPETNVAVIRTQLISKHFHRSVGIRQSAALRIGGSNSGRVWARCRPLRSSKTHTDRRSPLSIGNP